MSVPMIFFIVLPYCELPYMVTVYHYSTVNSVKILIFTLFFAFVGGFSAIGNENSLLPNLPFAP